MSEFQHTLLWL